MENGVGNERLITCHGQNVAAKTSAQEFIMWRGTILRKSGRRNALPLMKLRKDETVEDVTISEGRYRAIIVIFFEEWFKDKLGSEPTPDGNFRRV
ncbi:hypothetical protein AVEN_62190-1 [Araneus ventricosus]|uniref:Uncharacterized protein n=1 Tax=Araneus ventricosus TaxID=182803 RepID=A0A4Y2K8E0_ARAVE|nr:hypothetical protein AVEN_62190-1 [Araneus ventricosus]